MTNDPELKAMSEVYDALKGLDSATQRSVVDWVMSKLERVNAGAPASGAKRGPKPGKKRGPKPGRKRGRPAASGPDASPSASTGAKRGPKPGRKRGRPAAKKTGKRGRPAGSAKKSATKSSGRRGRPRKSESAASANPMA